MPSDIDIYRAAQNFLKRHGNDAEKMALDKMREFMARDDAKAASAWLAIADAINKLRRVTTSETVH